MGGNRRGHAGGSEFCSSGGRRNSRGEERDTGKEENRGETRITGNQGEGEGGEREERTGG